MHPVPHGLDHLGPGGHLSSRISQPPPESSVHGDEPLGDITLLLSQTVLLSEQGLLGGNPIGPKPDNCCAILDEGEICRTLGRSRRLVRATLTCEYRGKERKAVFHLLLRPRKHIYLMPLKMSSWNRASWTLTRLVIRP